MIPISKICRHCEKVVCNGVGPEGMESFNKVLSWLRSTRLFTEPANRHDMGYHLQIGKDLADTRFLNDMLCVIDEEYTRAPSIAEAIFNGDSYKRTWYKKCAYRNYYAVKFFGLGAYERAKCTKLRERI